MINDHKIIRDAMAMAMADWLWRGGYQQAKRSEPNQTKPNQAALSGESGE